MHRVVVLLDDGFYGADLRAVGVEVEALRLDRTKASLSGLIRLSSALRRGAPDVVHTWLYHANLAGLLASRASSRTPVLWSLRCSQLQFEHYPLMTLLVVRALATLSRFPDAIVANSQAGVSAHADLGFNTRRMTVIPNGIDTAEFRPSAAARTEVRTELGLAPDEIVIGCIARHDRMKNHRLVLQSFGELTGSPRLLLAGRGTENANDELLDQIIAAGLDPQRVLTLGERRDVQRLYAAIDLCVLGSSYGEGFPNVIGEAMACGVPCAVTDVGNSARIVGNLGKIAPPDDAGALTRALQELLTLPEGNRRALGAKAREHISTYYSIDAMVDAYHALYERLSESLR